MQHHSMLPERTGQLALALPTPDDAHRVFNTTGFDHGSTTHNLGKRLGD